MGRGVRFTICLVFWILSSACASSIFLFFVVWCWLFPRPAPRIIFCLLILLVDGVIKIETPKAELILRTRWRAWSDLCNFMDSYFVSGTESNPCPLDTSWEFDTGCRVLMAGAWWPGPLYELLWICFFLKVLSTDLVKTKYFRLQSEWPILMLVLRTGVPSWVVPAL